MKRIRTKSGRFIVVHIGGMRKAAPPPPNSLPKKLPGAKLQVAVPEQPERIHSMTRAQALAMFEPLPIPPSWTVYASAPDGEVACRMLGMRPVLRAARLLYDMGTVDLAQRRTESGTEYLIRRSHR